MVNIYGRGTCAHRVSEHSIQVYNTHTYTYTHTYCMYLYLSFASFL